MSKKISKRVTIIISIAVVFVALMIAVAAMVIMTVKKAEINNPYIDIECKNCHKIVKVAKELEFDSKALGCVSITYHCESCGYWGDTHKEKRCKFKYSYSYDKYH